MVAVRAAESARCSFAGTKRTKRTSVSHCGELGRIGTVRFRWPEIQRNLLNDDNDVRSFAASGQLSEGNYFTFPIFHIVDSLGESLGYDRVAT